MKTSVRITVALLLGVAAASAGLAGNRSNPELLVVGPVESIDLANGTAIILGQRVHTATLDQLAVGNAVAVFGTERVDGSIVASAIQPKGLYVPGATSIFLSGRVEGAESALGRVTVNGVAIDLTSVMSSGMLSPALGSRLAVSGTQPASHGIVLVSGIAGTGSAVNGIAGTGSYARGIAGTGSAVNGIAGTGSYARGIAGTGSAVNGIAGTGSYARGIAGTGSAVK